MANKSKTIKTTKELTAKLVAQAVLKVIREAGMPVAEASLPKFVRLELGALGAQASDAAILGASVALRSDKKLINAGTYRGSAMLALAW